MGAAEQLPGNNRPGQAMAGDQIPARTMLQAGGAWNMLNHATPSIMCYWALNRLGCTFACCRSIWLATRLELAPEALPYPVNHTRLCYAFGAMRSSYAMCKSMRGSCKAGLLAGCVGGRGGGVEVSVTVPAPVTVWGGDAPAQTVFIDGQGCMGGNQPSPLGGGAVARTCLRLTNCLVRECHKTLPESDAC
eukprot:364840-Chlamydomonas_euryale.AAC.17